MALADGRVKTAPTADEPGGQVGSLGKKEEKGIFDSNTAGYVGEGKTR